MAFVLLLLLHICITFLWEYMSQLESLLLTTVLSINPAIADLFNVQARRTPVQSCLIERSSCQLDQRTSKSCSHFLKAYFRSQPSPCCCSTGTDLTDTNCQEVILPFLLENEQICNSHSQLLWGFYSTLSSHRPWEASLNTFFRKCGPVGS